MKFRILIVDDEDIIRLSMSEGLKDLGYDVCTSKDGYEAIEELKNFRPHIIFLDLRLHAENGLEVLSNIKKIESEAEVIIMTAYGDIHSAVEAIKLGAYDYINKPFDLQEIDIIVKQVIQNLELKKKVYILENQAKTENIIGESNLMKDIFSKINILSKNDNVTVLIRGDSGTGKELVANAIHLNSGRKSSNMLKINCGAIPPNLIESELFGFEKNSFTGAAGRKKGLIEIADGGTLFLDEIGELPLEVQPKLLRVLEERKFKRIGGLKDIEVDIRIIAATNKDLEEAIRNRKFREDLYYRLNVVPIYLPPLRERGEDIIILANDFLKEFNKKFKKGIKGFTKEAEDALMSYSWKGNVRELRNIVERIALLTENEYIDIENLPYEVYKDKTKINKFSDNILNCDKIENSLLHKGFSLEKEIEKIEIHYIKLALDCCNNNHSKASEMLGMSRFAFKRRMERYFEQK